MVHSQLPRRFFLFYSFFLFFFSAEVASSTLMIRKFLLIFFFFHSVRQHHDKFVLSAGIHFCMPWVRAMLHVRSAPRLLRALAPLALPSA